MGGGGFVLAQRYTCFPPLQRLHHLHQLGADVLGLLRLFIARLITSFVGRPDAFGTGAFPLRDIVAERVKDDSG